MTDEIYKGYEITLEPDQEPESPREWDNIGIMICTHSRYNLGDGPPDAATKATLKQVKYRLPLYLYDHSGLVMGTSNASYPFSDLWDVSFVGWIYTTVDRLRTGVGRRYTDEQVYDILRSEVEVYNQYLAGDIWGFIIKDPEGEEVDSCWGFYGQEYCLEEAKQVVDYLIEKES